MSHSNLDGGLQQCVACPVSRLLIFHPELPIMCTEGKGLDEGASIEELSSHILYYRCSSPNFAEQSTQPSFASNSAVQFAGLASALYSLPTSVGATKDDNTTEIHLENSSLIFVPLEPKSGIIAVVQVSRLCPPDSNSKVGCGNPLAIRASIERCHQLFCMLRGGGIHRRLLRRMDDGLYETTSVSKSESELAQNTTCGYPGMVRLFALRKRKRRLAEKLEKAKSEDHAALSDEVENVSSELENLWNEIPLRKIQTELEEHYDGYLGDLSLVASKNGGAFRCMVETIPVPIHIPTASHSLDCLSPRPASHVAIHLGQSIRSILANPDMKTPDGPILLGITTFVHGQPLYTHTLCESICSYLHDTHKFLISYETSSILMSYMASYYIKMQQQQGQHSALSATTETSTRLGRPFNNFSLTSRVDGPKDTSDGVDNITTVSGQFLSVPPLSMLSASDDTHRMQGPAGEEVWAPWIHLPLQCMQQGEIVTNHVLAQVVMYEVEDFSFLFYVLPSKRKTSFGEGHGTSISHDEDARCASLLNSIATNLLDSITLSLGLNTARKDSQTKSPLLAGSASVDWAEPGQDIIMVDRRLHRMILCSRKSNTNQRNSGKEKKVHGKDASRRSKGLSGGKGEKQLSAPADWMSNVHWSNQGLDCRHFLASRLPLDSVLAFDDVMNEVYEAHCYESDFSASFMKSCALEPLPGQSRVVELCTFMSQGWIYAHAEFGRELYILFDSRLYVTVADVQNAATKIRKEFLGDGLV